MTCASSTWNGGRILEMRVSRSPQCMPRSLMATTVWFPLLPTIGRSGTGVSLQTTPLPDTSAEPQLWLVLLIDTSPPGGCPPPPSTWTVVEQVAVVPRRLSLRVVVKVPPLA
jgi:hypothetical protein